MKSLKLFFLLLPLITSCISMMETAKIRNGFRYNPNFQYSKITPPKSSWKVETQSPHVVGLGFKFSYGRLLDKKLRFEAELGVALGVLYYPTILGVTEYDEDKNKYKIVYYPYNPHDIQTHKIFGRFAIFQNKRTSLALKLEMAGERFASTGMVVSTKFKKKEIYSGFTVFNRFLKTPEQKMFGSQYGEYFCLGIEIPTNKNFLDTSKFTYIIIEIGVANKLWYYDETSFCISTGFVIN